MADNRNDTGKTNSPQPNLASGPATRPERGRKATLEAQEKKKSAAEADPVSQATLADLANSGINRAYAAKDGRQAAPRK